MFAGGSKELIAVHYGRQIYGLGTSKQGGSKQDKWTGQTKQALLWHAKEMREAQHARGSFDIYTRVQLHTMQSWVTPIVGKPQKCEFEYGIPLASRKD